MSEENEKPVEQAPAPAPAVAKPATAPAGNGIAIAALVVGIVAFVTGWVPILGLLLGIAAVVLGVIGLKKAAGKGMSIAGLVTGAIGALTSLVFGIFWILAIVAAGSSIGAASTILQDEASQSQKQIDAKKDFAKGETAKFGVFDVKVNSVKRNYEPTEDYYTPAAGNEFVLVNIDVKNTSSEAESFYSYDLGMNVDGVSESAYFLDVSPSFEGGKLSAGATASGNLVFEVEKDAKLKLQYEKTIYDYKSYASKTLTYTLAL